jgi:hypothetical protein
MYTPSFSIELFTQEVTSERMRIIPAPVFPVITLSRQMMLSRPDRVIALVKGPVKVLLSIFIDPELTMSFTTYIPYLLGCGIEFHVIDR